MTDPTPTPTPTPNTNTNNNNNSFSHERYNLLIEFAHRHVDFHRSELISVLSLYDLVLGRDCLEIPLPNHNNHANGNDENCRPFLILSFSYKDVMDRFDMEDVDMETKLRQLDTTTNNTTTTNNNINTNKKQDKKRPTIASILSRCTLIRSTIELWGTGTTISNCADSARLMSTSTSSESHSHVLLATHTSHHKSWKMTIQTLGSKYTREEQDVMRSSFVRRLNFMGKIKMVDPDEEFILIREIELDRYGSPKYPRVGRDGELIRENNVRSPLGVYFGRILGGARDWRTGSGSNKLREFDLKKRIYLGPTSMDAELSLVMTNLAKVKKGSFCFDPFVGTGSILLTCGERGGYCFGTDIDIRVLRGRSREENIFSNFEQYGLPRPEIVRSDNAIYHRHYRGHGGPLFDAIVCDPPYGIRAGARKSGSKLDVPRPVKEDMRHDHIAQTKPYAVSDVMADLLDVAARTLVMGGRLVYVIPSMTDFDIKEDLPRHECLTLVHVCYQPLQSELGRRIVTMEKSGEYDVNMKEEYMKNVWVNGPESAEKCANIRDRLMEAAKSRPGYEEKAAYRKKRRQETKQAKKKAKNEKKQQLGSTTSSSIGNK